MEGEADSTTPKAKLNFDLSIGQDTIAQKQWIDTNPFVVLNEEDQSYDFFKKTQEYLRDGCTFQRKKKHTVKGLVISSPR